MRYIILIYKFMLNKLNQLLKNTRNSAIITLKKE